MFDWISIISAGMSIALAALLVLGALWFMHGCIRVWQKLTHKREYYYPSWTWKEKEPNYKYWNYRGRGL